MTGCVYLVGAGPGDPGLLTRRGAYLLEAADVIVYDRLVGQGVLALAGENAEMIDVGKNSGDHPVPQEEIGEILVREAKKHRTVVRLKGGDPFVFGRGGEEAEVLLENGVPFEIVPGVTSAVSAPAYAGIPVTHRDFASSLHIITGHGKRDTEVNINYDALTKLRGTLVFMMSVSASGDIMAGLLNAGMNAETPAAIVENGATLKQRHFVCTLETLAQTIVNEKVISPAVIVVGDVCSMQSKLSWLHNKKLFGCSVLVTRPKSVARVFGEALTQLGAEVMYYPCMKTRTLEFTPETAGNDWIAFTSAAGVTAFFDKLYARQSDARALSEVKIAAVGEKTAAKLREFGIIADFCPAVYDGESLAYGLLEGGFVQKGDKLTLYRAKEGGAELVKILTGAGVEVLDITAYETVPEDLAERVLQKFDFVTFTSTSCVNGFATLNKDADFTKMTAICIGEKTAHAARKTGMKVFVSDRAVTDAMTEKIAEVWNGYKTETAQG